jgi:hypothetical protein
MELVYAFAKVSIELIAIYFHSSDILNIQIREVAFCRPDFIIIKWKSPLYGVPYPGMLHSICIVFGVRPS